MYFFRPIKLFEKNRPTYDTNMTTGIFLRTCVFFFFFFQLLYLLDPTYESFTYIHSDKLISFQIILIFK